MRDTTELVVDKAQEPVNFWFEDYMVSVRWNNLLLGYDAEIYKQTKGEDSLVHLMTTGGKTVKQVTQQARELILDNYKS